MSTPDTPSDRERLTWTYAQLRSLRAAQGRYLWVLLGGCFYTLAWHLSSGDVVLLPLVDLAVRRALLEPIVLLFLCIVALSFFGTLSAAARTRARLEALAPDAGTAAEPARDVAEYLDEGFWGTPPEAGARWRRGAHALPLTAVGLWCLLEWIEAARALGTGPRVLLLVQGVNAVLVLAILWRAAGLWRRVAHGAAPPAGA